LYHDTIRFRRTSPKLDTRHPDFESARASFPSCERIALRAFARSEAARLANALIRPVGFDESFNNVVALFADCDATGYAATRSKRFDFVIMLLKGGKFERRIARRLHKDGKIGAETLAAVSA
jgi:hypothetical protein